MRDATTCTDDSLLQPCTPSPSFCVCFMGTAVCTAVPRFFLLTFSCHKWAILVYTSFNTPNAALSAHGAAVLKAPTPAAYGDGCCGHPLQRRPTPPTATMTLGTAGADWAGLMIFIIMIFIIMIFVIMLRWLTVTCCGGCSQRVLWISTAATAQPHL